MPRDCNLEGVKEYTVDYNLSACKMKGDQKGSNDWESYSPLSLGV
jgi:hypothetical protein